MMTPPRGQGLHPRSRMTVPATTNLKHTTPQADSVSAPELTVAGTLHVYVAFDWGDEVDLERARSLVPAEQHVLSRRRRTPSSIAYRPPPLRFLLEGITLGLPGCGELQATAEATIFDFAAVSVALHLPFRLSPAELVELAGCLAESAPLVQAARAAVLPLHRKLLPAISKPQWSDDLSEEYFVFHLPPGGPLPAEVLLDGQAGLVAALVRLEAGRLSTEEQEEALRLHLRYSPHDLFVADWAAALLVDQDCDETLQTVEFANLQLLEYRHIDNRLDDSLANAYRLTNQAGSSWRSFWHHHSRPLRALGELKVEANGLFERTGNVLKLVGDEYLARVYRLVAARFHLRDWERNIQRKLETAEGVYQILSDQADSWRMEFLELVVIFLIVLEVLLALFHR
jgi:hypothetical protein